MEELADSEKLELMEDHGARSDQLSDAADRLTKPARFSSAALFLRFSRICLAEVLHAFNDRGIFAACRELTFDVREDLVEASLQQL